MEVAVLSVTLIHVPTIGHLACLGLWWKNVLPEEQFLGWCYLFANTSLEIWVRDYSIFVYIHEVEDLVELSISQVVTPVGHKPFKLFFINLTTLVDIKVSKTLLQSFPLLSNLIKNSLECVNISYLSLDLHLVPFSNEVMPLLVKLEAWILNGIMPKNKAFTGLNGRS